jgi:hypothetical protein
MEALGGQDGPASVELNAFTSDMKNGGENEINRVSMARLENISGVFGGSATICEPNLRSKKR